MILKFKKFWSCFMLIACTLGLVAPTPARANGNTELQVLGIVGACAAVGSAFYLSAGSLWLKSCKASAQVLHQNSPDNPEGTISIDEWCTRQENNGVIMRRDAAFKTIVDEALGANEDALIFKKSYLNEPNRYSAFIKDINGEMSTMQRIMERAKSLSFVSGLTEFPRTLFKLFPDLDWKYEKFRNMCAQHNVVAHDGYIYPERWTAQDFQNMSGAVHAYIDQAIPKHNSITKLAVEVWWIYFQKYYRLQKLKNIITDLSSELERERKARAGRHAETAAAAAAAAAHTHQHVHVDNQKKPEAPQPAVLKVESKKPNYLKRAAYIAGGALFAAASYISYKMVAQALNSYTDF